MAELRPGHEERPGSRAALQPDAAGQHPRPGSDGEHRLQERLGSTERADRFYQDQVLDHLNARMREFTELQEMFFLATSDARGECDSSFRAGPPGFVRVLDERTLVYPEYRGNGVHASMGNIQENPHVGILLIDFLRARIGLHINGRAEVIEDEEIRSRYSDLPVDPMPGRAAQVWVKVTVEEAYIHCAKHIPHLQPVTRGETPRDWGTDDTRRKGGDYFGVAAEARHRRRSEEAAPSPHTPADPDEGGPDLTPPTPQAPPVPSTPPTRTAPPRPVAPPVPPTPPAPSMPPPPTTPPLPAHAAPGSPDSAPVSGHGGTDSGHGGEGGEEPTGARAPEPSLFGEPPSRSPRASAGSSFFGEPPAAPQPASAEETTSLFVRRPAPDEAGQQAPEPSLFGEPPSRSPRASAGSSFFGEPPAAPQPASAEETTSLFVRRPAPDEAGQQAPEPSLFGEPPHRPPHTPPVETESPTDRTPATPEPPRAEPAPSASGGPKPLPQRRRRAPEEVEALFGGKKRAGSSREKGDLSDSDSTGSDADSTGSVPSSGGVRRRLREEGPRSPARRPGADAGLAATSITTSNGRDALGNAPASKLPPGATHLVAPRANGPAIPLVPPSVPDPEPGETTTELPALPTVGRQPSPEGRGLRSRASTRRSIGGDDGGPGPDEEDSHPAWPPEYSHHPGDGLPADPMAWREEAERALAEAVRRGERTERRVEEARFQGWFG